MGSREANRSYSLMDIDGESFAKINVSSYKTGLDNKNKEEVVRDIELANDTAMAYK
jgi:hypothetical protein